MSPFRIIIAEDDAWYSELLSYHLALNPDYEVSVVSTGKELLEQLHTNPAVVTLDYALPDANGSELLQRVKRELPHTEVVIVSGQQDVSTAVQLLRDGAYDYVVKDVEAKDRLWNTVNNIRKNLALKEEVEVLREEVGRKYDFSKTIVGKSPAITGIFQLLEKATKSDINVSITGETGTGKEVIAKAIHYNSERRKKPFVALNVSAIPAELMESELFGHEKGSFTGANSRRIGQFEAAGDGTLFLDEIGEMAPNMQAKLLRVLQERELVRVGGSETVTVSCRIICATHRDLQDEVGKGNFRQDLYYRILGLPIALSPLRARKEDILLLAKHFLETFAKREGGDPKTLSEASIEKLLDYHYPGNVRELKSVIELAGVLANDNIIEPRDITFHATRVGGDLLNMEMTLREYNHIILNRLLSKYNQDVQHVAKILDIGKSTIYRMLKEKDTA